MGVNRECESKNWRLEAAAASAIQDGLTADEVREVVEHGIAAGLASRDTVGAALSKGAEILASYRQRHTA